jgi:flagellar FliJ protein
MKKFKYRLAPLLKMREQEERNRQIDHAHALGRVHEQEQVNAGIARQREETMQRHRRRLEGHLAPGQLLLYSRYHQKLKRDNLTGQEVLKALRKEESRRRARLLEAARERKKYEKLGERLARRHAKDSEDAERKETDEMALSTYRLKH